MVFGLFFGDKHFLFRWSGPDGDLWADIPCTEAHSFLCEVPGVFQPPINDVFPIITRIVEESRYDYFPFPLDFISARDICLSRGGDLTRISSQDEFNLLLSIQDSVFVQIPDLRPEDNFFWVGVDALSTEEDIGTQRFTFTDGTTDGLSFVQGGFGEPPWNPDTPVDGTEFDCVL